MPILVISTTDFDGRISSGLGSRFQTELLTVFAYDMQFTKTKILMKIPGYSMVKGIAGGFDASKKEGLKPVALELGTAERVGFEIQKLPDGRSVIYIPSAPSPWSGITQVLPAEQVTYLDVPVTKIIEITESYGHGVGELLSCKVEGARL